MYWRKGPLDSLYLEIHIPHNHLRSIGDLLEILFNEYCQRFVTACQRSNEIIVLTKSGQSVDQRLPPRQRFRQH